MTSNAELREELNSERRRFQNRAFQSCRLQSQTVGPASIRAAVAAMALLMLAGAADAQNLNRDNIFAGYSFTGANLFTGQHASLNGWNVSGEKKFLPFFGVVADFSGHYGSVPLSLNACGASGQPACPTGGSVSEHYFQAGIRGSYAMRRVRPFAEVLFGAVHVAENAAGISSSKTFFAETLAVGMDYSLTRLLAWRVDAGVAQSGSFGSRQNSLRASTGAVFRF